MKTQGHVGVYPYHNAQDSNNGALEKPSKDYEVFIKGQSGEMKKSFTYWAQQHTPGMMNADENESFASFDCFEDIEVIIKVINPCIILEVDTNVVVRPLKAGIGVLVDVKSKTISFKLNGDNNIKQRILSVEIGNIKRPLFIFANPIELDIPEMSSSEVHVFTQAVNEDDVITQEMLNEIFRTKNTVCFKPGVHNIEHFELIKDNMIFYIAGGAVLRFRKKGKTGGPGSVMVLSGKNLKVLGRGIIDCKTDTESFDEYRCAGNVLYIKNSSNVRVDGIIFRHSSGFCLVAESCTNVSVSHVKMVGAQDLVSNDGILMDGTKDAVIDCCFANNHDDSLEVKAHYHVMTSTERVTFQNCVVWCRGGMPMGATWENWWDIKDITWKDCTVIHHECYGNGGLCVYVGNRGIVSNLIFQNIDIEDTLFGGICVFAEKHPWSNWTHEDVKNYIPESEISCDSNRNWPFFKDIAFRNITIQYNENFNSKYFPDPDTCGLGGWGFKFHIPDPAFASGNTVPLKPHLIGDVIFENVKILDYFDGAEFTRYGRNLDHKVGNLIKEHYLTDFTTDNWFVWEGANRTEEHSPEPGYDEKKNRIEFWEKKVKFIVTK